MPKNSLERNTELVSYCQAKTAPAPQQGEGPQPDERQRRNVSANGRYVSFSSPPATPASTSASTVRARLKSPNRSARPSPPEDHER